jgi:hypothetical protein
MAYKINGRLLQVGRSFTLGDIMYPANWLQKATQDQLSAVGIVWEEDPVRADDRYYWNGDINNPKMLDDRLEVDENGQPLWEQVLDNSDPLNPVMVDSNVQMKTLGLKSTMVSQVKHTAGTILAQTDWYVTRKSEKGIAVPTDVETKRDAVRTECDRLEAAINAVTTVEELITVMNSQDWGAE